MLRFAQRDLCLTRALQYGELRCSGDRFPLHLERCNILVNRALTPNVAINVNNFLHISL